MSRKKLKVIRVINELDFGGVERRIQLTVEGFYEDTEVKLLIVVLGNGGNLSESIQRDFPNTQLMILNEKYAIPNFKLIRLLSDLFRKESADVVHCSGAESNFHGIWASYMAGVKVRLAEEIGYPHHGFHWRAVFWLTYKFAHHVICISHAVAGNIKKLGEIKLKKAIVIYNPVKVPSGPTINLEDFGIGSSKKSPVDRVFVTTCRLVPIKNLYRLIEIFGALKRKYSDRSISLWIVGEGPEKDNLINLAENLGIQESVRFLGFQSNIRPFLEASDAFVLSSFSEGFSISLVEAMAVGLPCITTNSGGPAEIVKEGYSGFLFDPLDKEDMFGSLEKVIGMEKQELQAMGKNAQKASSLYSVSAYTKALKAIYFSSFQRNMAFVNGKK